MTGTGTGSGLGWQALRSALGVLPSAVPRRQRRIEGRAARVDGIAYAMPINSVDSPVLVAVFGMDYDDASSVLPGEELHPFRFRGQALFVVTVINYQSTDIGVYVEYALNIVVTHGSRPARSLLPGLLPKAYGLGAYVVDLPVSSEVSVKGGKGIWGMPKRQANLDFVVTDRTVSACYQDDGRLGCYVEIERPAPTRLPVNVGAASYSAFRGMLLRSMVYFRATADVAVGRAAKATLRIGDAPGVAALRGLRLDTDPILTAYLPDSNGVLDDYVESWFLTADTDAAVTACGGEGLDSVVGLSTSQAWLAPPRRADVPMMPAPV